MTHHLTESLITACNLSVFVITTMHLTDKKSKRFILRKFVQSQRTLMSFMYSPRVLYQLMMRSLNIFTHLTVHALDKQQLTKPSGPAIQDNWKDFNLNAIHK